MLVLQRSSCVTVYPLRGKNMETFAYLHMAQEYEYPQQRELSLSSRAMFKLLGVASTLGILNLTQAAQAVLLQRQDCGADVTRLQDLLRDAGYFPRSSTGFFGEVTEAAVSDLQRAKGLTIDGIAGDHTFKALETLRPVAPVAPVAPVTPAVPKPVPPTVPPTGRGNTLGFGDSGSGVTRLQDLLRRAGYLSGPSTGFFGAATQEALVRFQQANRLTADGFAGQAVIAARESAPALGNAIATIPVINTRPATTAPAPAAAFSRMLMVGDGGDDVRSLQRKLIDLRYYGGSVTGVFGEVTEAAVRNFQRDKNLPIDGIVGARTAALLQ
jgi:peptidoglycan hydrolase-like protein with peptidoglycan-binding domain